jgi:hypothetical protein
MIASDTKSFTVARVKDGPLVGEPIAGAALERGLHARMERDARALAAGVDGPTPEHGTHRNLRRGRDSNPRKALNSRRFTATRVRMTVRELT